MFWTSPFWFLNNSVIDIPDDGDLDPLQKDNIQVAILFKSLLHTLSLHN